MTSGGEKSESHIDYLRGVEWRQWRTGRHCARPRGRHKTPLYEECKGHSNVMPHSLLLVVDPRRKCIHRHG